METEKRVRPSVLKMQIENLQKQNERLTIENTDLRRGLSMVESQKATLHTKFDTLITFVKSLEEM